MSNDAKELSQEDVEDEGKAVVDGVLVKYFNPFFLRH